MEVGEFHQALGHVRASVEMLQSFIRATGIFPVARVASICTPVWNQEDEQHEDDQEDNCPSSISTKASVHMCSLPSKLRLEVSTTAMHKAA